MSGALRARCISSATFAGTTRTCSLFSQKHGINSPPHDPMPGSVRETHVPVCPGPGRAQRCQRQQPQGRPAHRLVQLWCKFVDLGRSKEQTEDQENILLLQASLNFSRPACKSRKDSLGPKYYRRGPDYGARRESAQARRAHGEHALRLGAELPLRRTGIGSEPPLGNGSCGQE
jgi:hypothetical protein